MCVCVCASVDVCSYVSVCLSVCMFVCMHVCACAELEPADLQWSGQKIRVDFNLLMCYDITSLV